MKRKLWLILGILVVVAAAGLYLASPLMAFRSLAEAAETGDEAGLERMVDFPAVRESLKDQLNARLIGALRKDPALSEGPFGQLGALLGPSIVDQVVNVALTPQGVAAMVRTGRAPLSDVGQTAPPPPEPRPAPQPGAEPDRSTSFAYDGLNRFRATMVRKDRPEAPLTWVLERRGLVGWKLVAIELPPERP
jgi:hypothetical protein